MPESSRSVHRLGVLLMACVIAGCGGAKSTTNPTAPSPSSAAPIAMSPGLYRLTLATDGFDTSPGSAYLCLGVGAGAPTHAAVTVSVEAIEIGWSVRATTGTLTMTLQAARSGVAGTLRGFATSADGQASVSVSDGGAGLGGVPVTGVQYGVDVLSGTVLGDVTLASGSSSMSCNVTSWSLSRP
jgi:hypothetical protein